ncbi:enoyl-CoA hydratase-related protein [Maritalea sp.]|uniref:enoyl-CoA hydratase-related protein n=1 Tax=Maritalea sp. TaxID=2003361 RepID=UPI003EF93EDD
MTQTILVEKIDRVVHITLNRPEALNALNLAVMDEITTTLAQYDADPEVGCFVISGSPKAFAAGADIKEMQNQTYTDMAKANWFAGWDKLTATRTPILAAVNGYALGGGCELAMMCDVIYAGDRAKFGQPEIKLGVIPGMGGSQRLTKLVGKSKAMDMVLTGRMMDAEEAERSGLAARTFPADQLVEEVLKIAAEIAGFGKLATQAAKEAVNQAEELGLRQGVLFERRTFHALFGTHDQQEGMAAFTEKRDPIFKGE